MSDRIYAAHPYIATLTALALSMPMLGGRDHAMAAVSGANFQPLDQNSSKLLEAAVQRQPYTPHQSDAVYELMTKVALRLVRESKPLERDFSAVVDREFWNLLA